MKEQGGGPQERPTEYPYEPLYRPWSWALSSVSNILLFAVLFGAIYAMYRQRKSKGKRQVDYRTVETKKTEVMDAEGKIKALVTGGSGALGREIVRQLIEDRGYRVYSLDLIIPDEEDRNEDVYSYIQADITDRDSLRLALRDIEVVYHTAAIVPMFVGYTTQDFYNVIARGTENVVAVCKEHKVKRLIYTSSVNVMISSDPNQDTVGIDETTPYPKHPREPYGGAKIVAEKCVLGANSEEGMLTCALRPCLLADVKVIKDNGSWYFGDGSHRQVLIPADTAAKIHILAEKKLQNEGCSSVVAGSAYIVALKDSFTHREYAEFIAGEQSEKAHSIPMWLLRFLVYFNEYSYRLSGWAPVSRLLRLDMIEFMTRSHTYSGALGQREIGWEDNRTWKDVVRELLKQNGAAKKRQ